MSTETTQQDIIMTVFSSQGKNNNRINIKGGSLWEDVKKTLKNNGYNIDSMKCIESLRKGVLEHPKAVIPTQDFNLHLYPVKTKGGAKPTFDRKAIIESIKKHIVAQGDKAKKFFSPDKSYTNTSTEELNSLLTKWEKKHGPAPDVELPTKTVKAKVSKEKSEAIVGVDSLAKDLVEDARGSVANTPVMAIKTCLHLLRTISGHENQMNVENAITQLEKSLVTKPTPSEEELLEAEHTDLGAGLQGVNY